MTKDEMLDNEAYIHKTEIVDEEEHMGNIYIKATR